jgi:hypothetical protein
VSDRVFLALLGKRDGALAYNVPSPISPQRMTLLLRLTRRSLNKNKGRIDRKKSVRAEKAVIALENFLFMLGVYRITVQ